MHEGIVQVRACIGRAAAAVRAAVLLPVLDVVIVLQCQRFLLFPVPTDGLRMLFAPMLHGLS